MNTQKDNKLEKLANSGAFYVQRFSSVIFSVEILIVLFFLMLDQKGFGWESVFILVIFVMSSGWLWGDITEHPCISKIWDSEPSIRIGVYTRISIIFSSGLIISILRFIDWLSPENRNFWCYMLIIIAIIHLFTLSSKMKQKMLQHCSVGEIKNNGL